MKVGSHRLLRAHGLGGWEESGPGLLVHLPVKVTRPTSGVTWLRGAAVPAMGDSGCGHHRDSPETGRRPPAATVCHRRQHWAQMARQPRAAQVQAHCGDRHHNKQVHRPPLANHNKPASLGLQGPQRRRAQRQASVCPWPAQASQQYHRQGTRHLATDLRYTDSKEKCPRLGHKSHHGVGPAFISSTHRFLNKPPSFPPQGFCMFCSLCLECSSLQLCPSCYMILTFHLRLS